MEYLTDSPTSFDWYLSAIRSLRSTVNLIYCISPPSSKKEALHPHIIDVNIVSNTSASCQDFVAYLN